MKASYFISFRIYIQNQESNVQNDATKPARVPETGGFVWGTLFPTYSLAHQI